MLLQTLSFSGVSLPPGLVVNALIAPAAPFNEDDLLSLKWTAFRQRASSDPAAFSTLNAITPRAVQPPQQLYFVRLNGTFLTTPLVSAPGLAARTPEGLAFAYSSYARNAWLGPRYKIASGAMAGNSSPWISDPGILANGARISQGVPDIRDDQAYIIVNSPVFRGNVEIHNVSGENAPMLSDWLVPADAEGDVTPETVQFRYLCAPLNYYVKEMAAMANTVIHHTPVFNVAQIEESYELHHSANAVPISVITEPGSAQKSSCLIGYLDSSQREKAALARTTVEFPSRSKTVTFFAPSTLVPQVLQSAFTTITGKIVLFNCLPATVLGDLADPVLVSSGLQFYGKLPGAYAWSKQYDEGGLTPRDRDYYELALSRLQASPNLTSSVSGIVTPAYVGLDRFKNQILPQPDNFRTVMESVPILDEREWMMAAAMLDIVPQAAVPDLPMSYVYESLINRASHLCSVYHSVSGAPSGEIF